MQINFTDEVDKFSAIVGDWLANSPAENNVMLTAIENQRAGHAKGTSTATYGWATDDSGEILGALRWAPPLTARMTVMPESAARALADELSARNLDLPGVNGPHECAVAFATRWEELTGQGTVHVRKLQMSQLNEVRLAQWPQGTMRHADTGEADLLTSWITAMLRDSGMSSPEVAARQQVEEQLAGQRLYVWDDGGKPVAVAGHAVPVHRVVRLAGGYSPPEHRSTNWYGIGLAAAVGDTLFKQGCIACIAITDESNPYTAAALRMIGYSPVLLLSEHHFARGAKSGPLAS